MSVQTPPHVQQPSVLARLWLGIVSMADPLEESVRMRARFFSLTRMSKEDLAKLGLSRSEIPQAVALEAEEARLRRAGFKSVRN